MDRSNRFEQSSRLVVCHSSINTVHLSNGLYILLLQPYIFPCGYRTDQLSHTVYCESARIKWISYKRLYLLTHSVTYLISQIISPLFLYSRHLLCALHNGHIKLINVFCNEISFLHNAYGRVILLQQYFDHCNYRIHVQLIAANLTLSFTTQDCKCDQHLTSSASIYRERCGVDHKYES